MVAALALAVLSLVHIDQPPAHSFDEVHYIPAAIALTEMKGHRNWEHPPLAKYLMAGSIKIFGDGPLGWRFPSVVFGAMTLFAVAELALILFGVQTYVYSVCFLWCSFFIFVQSRIALLDSIMVGFMALAVLFAAKHKIKTASALFGLAISCKWAAIPLWAVWVILPLVSNVVTKVGGPSEWGRDLIKRIWPAALAYFLTFLPLLGLNPDPKFFPGISIAPPYTFMDLFLLQMEMWKGMLRVPAEHHYASRWADWPLMTRPIWYYYQPLVAGNTSGLYQGVFLVGNPLIMILGLLALLYAAFRKAWAVVLPYFVLLAPYALFPRKLAFYYYYYPAALWLCVALAWMFSDLQKNSNLPIWKGVGWVAVGISALLFGYFYPVLAGSPIGPRDFMQWMWLRSWI